MTYSIIARDEVTGYLGMAVQSHFLAVGHKAVWGRAGVGMIASQANVSLDYGLTGLELLDFGATPTIALRECRSRDVTAEVRQVAMLDATGNVAAFTGEGCWDNASHHSQRNVSAQANMVANPDIPRAMVRAFLDTSGDLQRRLLAALDSAEALGGDFRGRQSSALLIVSGQRAASPDDGVIVDLRIDNSPEPLRELRRASELNDAVQRVWPVIRGAACRGPVAPTVNETESALRVLSTAQDVYGRENLEPSFWTAIALDRAGRTAEAHKLISTISQDHAGWSDLYTIMMRRPLGQRPPSSP